METKSLIISSRACNVSINLLGFPLFLVAISLDTLDDNLGGSHQGIRYRPEVMETEVNGRSTQKPIMPDQVSDMSPDDPGENAQRRRGGARGSGERGQGLEDEGPLQPAGNKDEEKSAVTIRHTTGDSTPWKPKGARIHTANATSTSPDGMAGFDFVPRDPGDPARPHLDLVSAMAHGPLDPASDPAYADPPGAATTPTTAGPECLPFRYPPDSPMMACP
ncbi:hypothetical protein GMORB2_5316 [Geosmithia morbida]|uniref:Uncharacterized protein n=1 Tax=Geosmithia morbida TaxID=1094350 RepID=A0A9P4YXH0_9HYPO|nr:uncharacterized protein GMORB2_5316 [Geosmithia morbida]KAF4124650.1 hypothetical protein GMORB2_5316 [Geosmithia morbida]